MVTVWEIGNGECTRWLRGEGADEARESGDVTVLSYAFDGMTGKWPIMEAWCQWVEEATAAAIANDSRLTDVEWIRAHVQRQRAVKKGRAVPPVDLVKRIAA